MGPSLLWHIGGGKGGIHHFMEQLMDRMAAMMKNLGNPEITAELKQTITEGVLREAGSRSVKQLAQEENEMLFGLRLRAGVGQKERSNMPRGCGRCSRRIVRAPRILLCPDE
jgi:hypothetical protein